MKIVIAGGTGFLGQLLSGHFMEKGYDVVILTRRHHVDKPGIQYVKWDGEHLDAWAFALENAEALINLNGKSVDCRYTARNKQQIYATRIQSTSVLGKAIQQCEVPPKTWINASSATIYRHAFDREMDEETGEMGEGFSVDVCQKWEQAFHEAKTHRTRKVILRIAIVLGKSGGALKPLVQLAKMGLGGKQGRGDQYFSWIHEEDFIRIVDFAMCNEQVEGIYNVSAPNPLPNTAVMSTIRKAVGVPFGAPMPRWLLEIGALLIRTETELILKSRRVVPGRLSAAGFKFSFSDFDEAIADLYNRSIK